MCPPQKRILIKIPFRHSLAPPHHSLLLPTTTRPAFLPPASLYKSLLWPLTDLVLCNHDPPSLTEVKKNWQFLPQIRSFEDLIAQVQAAYKDIHSLRQSCPQGGILSFTIITLGLLDEATRGWAQNGMWQDESGSPSAGWRVKPFQIIVDIFPWHKSKSNES